MCESSLYVDPPDHAIVLSVDEKSQSKQVLPRFGKRERWPGKHSLPRGENPIRNNGADVAELVDARDLKFVAPFEINRVFCITRPETKTKIDAKRRDLHNARIAALAALALITAPAFG